MIIDIFTSFKNKNHEYAVDLMNNLLLLSSGAYKFNFKCIVDKIITGTQWTMIEDKRVGMDPHSSAYGSALNCLYDYIDADYVIITHADVALLKLSWDELMLKYFENNIAIVGCGWPRSSMTFPSSVFSIFKSDILLKIKPNFTPNYHNTAMKKNHKRFINRKLIGDPKEANMLGMQVGDILKLDTFTNVPYAYSKMGYGWKAFTGHISSIPYDLSNLTPGEIQKFNTHKTRDMWCDYTVENEIFASHLGQHGYYELVTQVWINGVKNYINSIDANRHCLVKS